VSRWRNLRGLGRRESRSTAPIEDLCSHRLSKAAVPTRSHRVRLKYIGLGLGLLVLAAPLLYRDDGMLLFSESTWQVIGITFLVAFCILFPLGSWAYLWWHVKKGRPTATESCHEGPVPHARGTTSR